jgi:hypothetical protein
MIARKEENGCKKEERRDKRKEGRDGVMVDPDSLLAY